ncbi:MAG TPA: hypothetical protein VG651_20815 [Stellaceae bacterium]|nr:hypothetical protein [Stellaceae bacterium]
MRFLLTLPLVAGVFLPRFAFTFHGRELSLPLLVIVASIAGLAAIGRLRVHLPRLILFAVSIAAMMTAILLGGAGRVSAMSFLLLAVLYLGYVFVVDGDEATYAWVIGAFRRMCLIVAVAGIAQFLAQIVVRGPTLFTFRGVIPDSFLALEYNYVDPTDFLPGFYKSNGFFLPEPSIFGQLMALAAITETLFFRPSYRLFIIGLALFVSFSGTGAILCLVFIPLLLLRRGNPSLLLLAAGLGVLLIIFSGSPYLAPYLNRFGEFGSTYSSGFARFLSPLYLFNDFIFTSARNTLFGLGPGAIESFFNNYYTEVHDPTWGKLFFEYGLVGTLPFALFITCSFFADAPVKWLTAALFLNWLVMGGYLLSPPIAGLILPLAVWHRAARMTAAARVQAGRLGAGTRAAGSAA